MNQETTTVEKRICKNCRYMKKWGDYYACEHSESEHNWDPVKGTVRHHSCHDMRNKEEKCGKEGKFFIEKTPKVSLWMKFKNLMNIAVDNQQQ